MGSSNTESYESFLAKFKKQHALAYAFCVFMETGKVSSEHAEIKKLLELPEALSAYHRCNIVSGTNSGVDRGRLDNNFLLDPQSKETTVSSLLAAAAAVSASDCDGCEQLKSILSQSLAFFFTSCLALALVAENSKTIEHSLVNKHYQVWHAFLTQASGAALPSQTASIKQQLLLNAAQSQNQREVTVSPQEVRAVFGLTAATEKQLATVASSLCCSTKLDAIMEFEFQCFQKYFRKRTHDYKMTPSQGYRGAHIHSPYSALLYSLRAGNPTDQNKYLENERLNLPLRKQVIGTHDAVNFEKWCLEDIALCSVAELPAPFDFAHFRRDTDIEKALYTALSKKDEDKGRAAILAEKLFDCYLDVMMNHPYEELPAEISKQPQGDDKKQDTTAEEDAKQASRQQARQKFVAAIQSMTLPNYTAVHNEEDNILPFYQTAFRAHFYQRSELAANLVEIPQNNQQDFANNNLHDHFMTALNFAKESPGEEKKKESIFSVIKQAFLAWLQRQSVRFDEFFHVGFAKQEKKNQFKNQRNQQQGKELFNRIEPRFTR